MKIKQALLFSCVLFLFKQQSVSGQELDDILSNFDDIPVEQAQEPESEIDDMMSGFDEPAAIEQVAAELVTEGINSIIPSWLQLAGNLKLAGSANFAHNAPEENEPDFRGLSMLRTRVGLSGDVRYNGWHGRVSGHGFYDAAYSIQGREQYSGYLLDSYEQEVEIEDIFLAGSLTPSIDIKTGRQIIVWGKSDNVRVTDILNPLDQRLPGMVDIKDLRLPVTMTRLDYYFGDWNLNGIMLHEVRFGKYPAYNSDFYPGAAPPPPELVPDFSLDNQQYGLALNGIFSGWDLSLYGAWVFDERTHLVQNIDNSIVREHGRVAMGGVTANVAVGNWLIKAESAGFDGLVYSAMPDEEFARLDMMAGVEYMGFSETLLSLEIVNRHIVNFNDRLHSELEFVQEDSNNTVVKLVRDFAHDTIQLKILVSIFGTHGEDGVFERFQLDYDYNDSITLTGGVIFYQDADQGPLADIDDNDRVFFEIKYEF